MLARTFMLKACLYLSIQILTVTCNSVSNIRNNEGDCKHDSGKLISNCTLDFHGNEIHVKIQLYPCNQPTEMMVDTKIDGLNVEHSRVFVNDDERVPLTGYNGAYVHVQMHQIKLHDLMQVKVAYYTIDRFETVAYDQNVSLHIDSCPPQDNDDKVFTPFVITIIIALSLVIFSGMTSFIILYKLHQQRARHETKLVSQMESTAMTCPYQVGPSESSLRVEYKIAMESQKTSDKDEVYMNPAVVLTADQKQSDSKTNHSHSNQANAKIKYDLSHPRPKSIRFNKDSVYPVDSGRTHTRPSSHPRPNSRTANVQGFDSKVTMMSADQRGSRHSLTHV